MTPRDNETLAQVRASTRTSQAFDAVFDLTNNPYGLDIYFLSLPDRSPYPDTTLWRDFKADLDRGKAIIEVSDNGGGTPAKQPELA